MLSKNKIDKNLKKYIREHLGRGYSKNAIHKVLTDHGYNEHYISELIKKHSEEHFIKKYAIIVSLLFAISMLALHSFNLIPGQKITGQFTLGARDEGCCTPVCEETPRVDCYGEFIEDKKCSVLDACNVGCCIDKEGYCLANYLTGNCIKGYGKIINRDCTDIFFCSNITDKSYYSRLHNAKDLAGVSASGFLSDYYGSSLNLRFYLYDKSNVILVNAIIKDSNETVGSIALYDDGSHNDGAKDDSIYGNNWPSSRMAEFDGYKKLSVDIIIRYKDASERLVKNAINILLLKNNKCLPILNEPENSSQGIIFAADNYANESDGQSRFESDTLGFQDSLFSVEKFSKSKNQFNIFRLDNSLSYFNTATLLGIISGSCPFYRTSKDLVIILDKQEDYCVNEGENLVRVNPKVLFYKNISDYDTNKIFHDFCGFVLTPKKLTDDIITYITPPKITIFTPDNLTYDNITSINLSFDVWALNYPVNYLVFEDNLTLINKTSGSEVIDNTTITLVNGTNFVLIKAADKNDNKVFLPLFYNVTK